MKYKVTGPDQKSYAVDVPQGASQDEAMAYVQEKFYSQSSTQAEPQEQGFPYDAPNTEYGEILPFARNTKTGETSFAAPEIIRSPLRGMISRGKDLSGSGKPVGDTTTSPDELAAVAAVGTPAAPGAGKTGLPGPARQGTQPFDAAKAAHGAGYVLPPNMTSEAPGAAANMTAGWGGKVKLEQQASFKNQEVTNNLAAKALGLPDKTVLSDQVFSKLRADAGRYYQAVADAIPEIVPDEAFKTKVAAIGSQNSQAAQYFPDLMSNEQIKSLTTELAQIGNFPPRAGLEAVKQLRYEATQNLKAIGDPKKHALGLAQREAADAVDGVIERNLEESAYKSAGGNEAGVPFDLVEKYRRARQIIARSYDVESVTNTATGDVSAMGLGKLSDKGRPLGADLRTIADAALAYPRAFQNTTRYGGNEPHSAMDFFGSAFAVAHGNPSVAGAILGRPLARSALLSKQKQGALMQPGTPSPMSAGMNALQRAPLMDGADQALNPDQM